ncbi:MAG: cupin-like domain-containing protein [Halieaceae bacterium]|jgi:hypothetical protein|nr:cupin-like domain-containing protein [Halieaceae bacterium]
MHPSSLRQLPEASSAAAFELQVAEGEEPVVLRAAASHWSSVRAAKSGRDTFTNYLHERDTGHPVYAILGQPEIGGRFGFDRETRGVNYAARQSPLGPVLARFEDAAAGGYAIAIQAAPVRKLLRNWDTENTNPWLPASVDPTMWVSMASRVAPHSDVHDNIAVVVAGSRRFTLYPPEQIDNLYLGPLLSSPGGVPTSSVDIWNPDLDRHPKYARAADSARSSTLYPGDIIYIPALWWHAVESIEALNVLVNFWFGEEQQSDISQADALSHAILAFGQLPPHKRRRWQRYFEHLVFRSAGDPAEHLPDTLSDLLSSPSPEQCDATRQRIARQLMGDQ